LVQVSEHESVAKWCGKDDLSSECFLVNKDGLVYVAEKKLSPKNVIKAHGMFDDPSSVIGQTYLVPQHFQKIIETIKNLDQLSIVPTSFETEDGETVIIAVSEGPHLMIDLNDEPSDILNNLKTTIETEEINEAQFKNLEYIDLRFGNKVYYKIK
jgi:hypothetical protein